VRWTRLAAAAAALSCLVALSVAVSAAQPLQAVETFDAAWTTIRDSHFDPTMNGVDWDAVRAELRPRAAAARSTAELRDVLREMLHRLGLSHFAIIPSSPDQPGAAGDLSGAPGFDVRLVAGDLVVTHVDDQTPQVHTGWRVVRIGNAAVADLLASLTAGAGSPSAAPQGAAGSERMANVEAWRISQTHLRGPSGSKVQVQFDDGTGRIVTVPIERHPEAGQPVTVGNLPTMFVRVEAASKRTPAGATAGVIAFNVWMAAVDAEFQKSIDKFRQADGIVIDLRGNPGGLAAMLMGISGHFVPDRQTLGVMKTRDSELRFFTNPRLASARGERVNVYAGPLAILVDALSGSASECFTGGMQSLGRARVFGQPSMGQALPALFDRLPNGDVLIHAYGDFVTSTGIRLEGRGVIPDEVQPLRREELLEGRDRPLEAALAWIDRVKAGSGPQHP
jgi:carboxyl-terminal processing protease